VSLRYQALTVAAPLLFLLSERAGYGQSPGPSTDWEVKELVYQVQAQWVDSAVDPRFYPNGQLRQESDVYLIDGPNLKSKRRLEKAESPAWSSDGRKLAFLGYCGGYVSCRNVEVTNADGSGRKALLDVPNPVPADFAWVLSFAWSPVEDKIAYIELKDRVGQRAVVITNADGSGQKEVPLPAAGRCKTRGFPSVAWSPDGDRVAVTGCADGQPEVFVIAKNADNAQAVVKGSDAQWSPDGKRLLFVHDSETPRPVISIWIANADGKEPQKLLDAKTLGLTWSPDGKSIAFASVPDHKHQSQIFRINVDGTGIEQLASEKGVSFSYPIFSPDGTKLVVGATPRSGPKDTEVLLIDTVTHRQSRLAKGDHAGVLWQKQ
jgi:Tol biopolymer transport system component